MSDTVIKVENLSKSYVIGHQSQEKYLALRDVVANKAKTIGNRLAHPFKSSAGGLITGDETEEFWALKDVSFEVKRGDRLGIIGRNGAGKSTLLKILSRITEPTKGRIGINGRVASLLEVGTGFHPELTGRENIFLNGAILGMSRIEVKRKFDEIVDFAEVEKFLDTPVKRFSSGMYVRLAFAVAAHLEPEILIVDEVLAVGDAQFQKKCLGKMEDVGEEGRTVLFVSHNMSAIQRLCKDVAFIEGGLLKDIGETHNLIDLYLSSRMKYEVSSTNLDLRKREKESIKSENIKLKKCHLLDKDNKETCSLDFGQTLKVKIEAKSNNDFENIKFVIGVDTNSGERIFTSDSEEFGKTFSVSSGGILNAIASFEGIYLMPGKYKISVLSIRSGFVGYDTLWDIGRFEVRDIVCDQISPPLVKTGIISGRSKWIRLDPDC